MGLRMIGGALTVMAMRMILNGDGGGFVALLVAVGVVALAGRAGRARD